MKFNEKLVYLRKKQSLTQEEVACKLNVSRQSISKWENGETEPEISKLKQLANIFDVSFDYLLNDNFEDTKPKETSKKDYENNKILWLIISITGFVIAFAIFIIASFSKPISTSRSGFWGFLLDNWSIDANILKIIMLVSVLLWITGIIKLVLRRKI